MSVFHRVDDVLSLSTADLLAKVKYLRAYDGALKLVLAAEQHETQTELPTGSAQPVEDPDNTPAEVVAAKRRAALLAKFPEDIAAGGVVEISPEEMAREVMSGG